jgi:acetylornithine/N-succinyldiaminopimelate aminotransferase
MMSYEEIVLKDSKYVFQTYTRQPLALKSGYGAVVRDVEGREYIDCVAGIASCNLGHCHPAVVNAIKAQAAELMHVTNLYYTEVQAVFSEHITSVSGMERVFFCNSGTEAVEAALKLARRTTGKRDFVAAHNSFHGRTLGALSITAKEQFRAPFEPLIEHVSFVPYNDSEALHSAITKDTAAVVLEPVQGEGGVNIPSDEYLKEVREVCDERDVLLILDEVQTGFGRTGEWFAYQLFGVKPDIITLGKAIANGFPMGAMLACGRAADGFQRGDHASTFGGNPLACAAANATLNALEGERLVEASKKSGSYFLKKLQATSLDFIDLRGVGLMIGMEFEGRCSSIVERARKRGVLLNCTSERVLRFVPPLCITREQIDRVVSALDE